MSAPDFDAIDFFRAKDLYQDPYPYYEYVRAHGPVWREPHRGVVMVTGFEEAMAVYNDPVTFSSCNTVSGPFTKFPVPLVGDDISAIIEEHRDTLPFSDQLPSFDPPRHTEQRGLLLRLITPKRLKENEEFMWTLAEGLIDEFADDGEMEFANAYARPFTLLVIADLLGVPREDHDTFREWLGGQKGTVGDPEGRHFGDRVFANLHPYFARYIEERRTALRDDVLSKFASVRFPDGELPELMDVVRLATIIFAAGQETTARLLAAAMRVIAEQPALADELRSDPKAIPNFIEECLRLEGPIKGSFRLAVQDTQLAGIDIPAGSIVMAVIGAANRDPHVFADPDHFDAKRSNARRNVAFGHGEHFCPGASLARTEARISFERLLTRLDGFQLVDPAALSYMDTFIIRGLNDLPLRFRRRS